MKKIISIFLIILLITILSINVFAHALPGGVETKGWIEFSSTLTPMNVFYNENNSYGIVEDIPVGEIPSGKGHVNIMFQGINFESGFDGETNTVWCKKDSEPYFNYVPNGNVIGLPHIYLCYVGRSLWLYIQYNKTDYGLVNQQIFQLTINNYYFFKDVLSTSTDFLLYSDSLNFIESTGNILTATLNSSYDYFSDINNAGTWVYSGHWPFLDNDILVNHYVLIKNKSTSISQVTQMPEPTPMPTPTPIPEPIIYGYTGIINGTTYGELPQILISAEQNVNHFARLYKRPVSEENGAQSPYKVFSTTTTSGNFTISNQKLPNGDYCLEIGKQVSSMSETENSEFDIWSTNDAGFWDFGNRSINYNIYNNNSLQNFQDIHYFIKFTIVNTTPLVKFNLLYNNIEVDSANIIDDVWKPIVQVSTSNTNDAFKITVNDKELNKWVGSYINNNIQGYTPFLKTGTNNICLYNTTKNLLYKTLVINMTAAQVELIKSENPIDSIHDDLNGSDYNDTVQTVQSQNNVPKRPTSINPIDWIIYLCDLVTYYVGSMIGTLSSGLTGLLDSFVGVSEFFVKLFSFLPLPVTAALSTVVILYVVFFIFKMARG